MSNLKKNFIYNIIYQIFTIIMPLVTAPYISRVLGAKGVGIYAYSFTVADYFVYFAMLGINNYGVRTIAKVSGDREKRSKEFINIFFIQLTTSVVALTIYIIYGLALVKENRNIALLQTLLVFSAALDINWFFFGIEKFKLTTTRNVIIKMSALIAIFIFVKKPTDIWIYTLIMASSYLLSQLLMWIFITKFTRYCNPSVKEMKKHIKPIIVLFIPVIAVTLYKMMDKILLGVLTDKVQVGLYESAEKISRVPGVIIAALGTSMLPRMSNLNASREDEKANYYISLSMEFAIFASCAMAFGLAGIAPILAPLYYGSEFFESGKLMMGLSSALIFSSWANVIRTQYLIPRGKDKPYVISVILGAVVNLIANILLISRLNAMGAVIGTIIAEATVSIYQSNAVKRELPLTKYLSKGIIYFLAGIVMFLAVRGITFLFEDSLILLVLQICIGVIAYFAICIPYWYYTRNAFAHKILNILKGLSNMKIIKGSKKGTEI